MLQGVPLVLQYVLTIVRNHHITQPGLDPPSAHHQCSFAISNLENQWNEFLIEETGVPAENHSLILSHLQLSVDHNTLNISATSGVYVVYFSPMSLNVFFSLFRVWSEPIIRSLSKPKFIIR